LGIKISCDAQQYLAVSGVWQPINDAYASAYPGTAVALDATTCATLKKGTTEVGRFVITPAKLIYLLINGKRRLVTQKQYDLIRGTTPAAIKIDDSLNTALPVGTALPANYKNVLQNPLDLLPSPSASPSVAPSANPTMSPVPSASASRLPSASPSNSASPSKAPSASPTPSKTASPTPSKTATPAPSPTATKSPTPTPSPTATTTKYVVVAGDNLTKIAAKFGVTVSALKAANGLTSDIVKLGQALVIPR
jgi:LysM repeat protein